MSHRQQDELRAANRFAIQEIKERSQASRRARRIRIDELEDELERLAELDRQELEAQQSGDLKRQLDLSTRQSTSQARGANRFDANWFAQVEATRKRRQKFLKRLRPHGWF